MGSPIYGAVSGAKAQARYLDIIANNLANINTVGYKADDLKFGDHMVNEANNFMEERGFMYNERPPLATNLASRELTYTQITGQNIDTKQGTIRQTGNVLDVALDGQGFLKVRVNEDEFFTRDGRIHVNEEGELIHASGGQVLDDSSNTIQIREGMIEIGEDGSIYQGDTEVGKLGLFDLPSADDIRKEGNSLFTYNRADAPPTESADTKVHQGFIEISNVNAVMEMTKMIKVQRHFETMNKVVKAYNEMDRRSIQDVGSTGN